MEELGQRLVPMHSDPWLRSAATLTAVPLAASPQHALSFDYHGRGTGGRFSFVKHTHSMVEPHSSTDVWLAAQRGVAPDVTPGHLGFSSSMTGGR